MRILVTGGTGFVGAALVRALVAQGHEVMVFTRDPAAASRRCGVRVEAVASLTGIPAGERIDALVNLAGEPIADRPWTAARRRVLEDSRIGVTRDLLALCARLDRRPQVLVSGSAIGYYGDTGDSAVDEQGPRGSGYAADLCAGWEAAAAPARELGMRLCIVRTGVVLGPGGMLARLGPVFRLGLGGRIGSGRQWMSWIHRDDLVALLLQLLADNRCEGVYNGTAPEPVTNAAFTAALAAALRRPALLPVPAVALRTLLGEAAGLLLDSQRVVPVRTAGVLRFRYPTLAQALVHALA